jgi:hypothetical protein
MPGLVVLRNVAPAERVPVDGIALLAGIIAQQVFERHLLAPARQFRFFVELCLGQFPNLVNVFDRTDRERVGVNSIQRILALDAPALFAAALPVLQAGAPFVLAACAAFTLNYFVHRIIR